MVENLDREVWCFVDFIQEILKVMKTVDYKGFWMSKVAVAPRRRVGFGGDREGGDENGEHEGVSVLAWRQTAC